MYGSETAGTVGDPVVEAIDELTGAIDANASDERLLARRLRRLRNGRLSGRSWRRLLESEPDPGSLALVGRILGRMSGASGGLRRALAQAARSEGESVADIARRFGVSHQRISTVLRSAAVAGGAAAPVVRGAGAIPAAAAAERGNLALGRLQPAGPAVRSSGEGTAAGEDRSGGVVPSIGEVLAEAVGVDAGVPAVGPGSDVAGDPHLDPEPAWP